MSKSKYIELYIVVCFSLPVHNHDLIMNRGMVYLFKCQAIVFFFGKQLDEQIIGMGLACFFWIGSSPSPYFLDRVEPGLQILSLKPMQAEKNSVRAYFEPQKYQ